MRAAKPRPSVPMPTPWMFPEPTEVTLDNGLRVWTFHLPGQHVLGVDVMFNISVNGEPREKEGVATLTLNCSDEGSQDHPGAQFNHLMEAQGASYGGDVTSFATVAGIQVSGSRLGAALPLLAEAVMQPAFAAEDVRRHVELRISQIERTFAQPGGAAAMAVRQAIHPASARLSRSVGGTRETVAGIEAADLADFRARHWRPDGATLIVGGDLPPQSLNAIEKAFAGWSSGAPPRSFEPSEPRAGRRIWVVDRPDSVQCEVRLARSIDASRNHPDWVGLQVASTAMGGAFGSRLNRVLREERGYTYGVHCQLAPLQDTAIFQVSAACRTEVAVPAVVEALALLELANDPLRPGEITDAISHIVGVAPLHFECADAIVQQAGTLAAVGLPISWINDYYPAVSQCTPEFANDAFQRHIQPDDLHVVMCGRAETLIPALESAGLRAEVMVPAH